uniref:PiggyBac transposable element-derived protein 4 n=1 Tax=Cacopsylla melanoneura TaxID=428564 RepID=A0A8D8X2J7_9HEMI
MHSIPEVEYGENVDYLDPCRRIFRKIIGKSSIKSNKKISQRPSQAEIINDRYDRMDHFVDELPIGASGKRKQLRCRFCGTKATTMCVKCNATLHVKCFMAYHTRNSKNQKSKNNSPLCILPD